MGSIATVIQAGIPASLVISILPHSLSTSQLGYGAKTPGKQPGQPGAGDSWVATSGWQQGVSADTLRVADAAGANAGLRCGVAAAGHSFYCLDFDIDLTGPAGVELLRRCLVGLSKGLAGASFAVRQTLEWRGSVLIRVPASAEPGTKRVVKLYRDGQSVGKIELLGHGQQTVVAGTHPSGRPLSWSLHGAPAKTFGFPAVSEAAFPTVPTYQHVATLLEFISHLLQREGYEVDVQSTSGTMAQRTDLPPVSLDEQAAPSLDILMRTLRDLPNPAALERDTYVRQQLAVVGCTRAMRKLNTVTLHQQIDALQAAAAWASRWEGPTPLSQEEEFTAFRRNWLQEPDIRLGWRHIVELATRLGADGLRFEIAQETFEALEDAPPEPPPLDASGFLDKVGRIKADRNRAALAVPQADIQVADRLESELGIMVRWITDEKRWIVFQGRQGWSDDMAESFVTLWVENMLVEYVGHYAGLHGSNDFKKTSELTSMLSHKRITNIVSMLRHRLASSSDKIDKGEYVIQTPAGAYDLRTNAIVPANLQVELMDTRYCATVPRAGATPLFDDLMWNLCDQNAEVLSWFWAYLGYSLLGHPNEHCFVFLWGPGGNGKSVLISVLEQLLGGYGCVLDRDVLLMAGRERHPASLHRLKGRRLSLTSEMPPNEKWNEARLKALTGGDKTEARRMHANPVTFRPEAAFLIAGQYMPIFHKVDQSVARRVRVIGTRRVPAVPDRLLESKIVATELPAILYRLMAEARAIADNSLQLPAVPRAMAREASKYLSEQDAFHGWYSTCCVASADAVTSMDLLRSSYEDYSKEAGDGDELAALDVLSSGAFSQALRRVGAVVEGEDGKRIRRLVGGKQTYVAVGVSLRVVETAVEEAA